MNEEELKTEIENFKIAKANWMIAQNSMKKDFENYKTKILAELEVKEKNIKIRLDKIPLIDAASLTTDISFFKQSQLNN